MAGKANKNYYLEDLYCSQTTDKSMELSALRDITNNFSKEAEIGSGGFGVVYRGVLRDGFVAVKKFNSAIDDNTFLGEVDCLTRIQHPNVVQYLGFCAGAYKNLAKYGEQRVLAETPHQLICFEYIRNGSLRQHIDAQPCRLAWHMCYKIIQGICLGLHYLHENRIIHRDMKPDNILLDDDMNPKITDFGISRLLGDGKSRIITEEIRGTLGYIAPECLHGRRFTAKSDIYSLGTIITEIVTGHKPTLMNEPVHECTRRLKLDASERQTELEQVKACLEISISCTQHEAHNRPVMRDILRRFDITETRDYSALGGMNASSLQPSATGKWRTEPSLPASAHGPGNTNPEKSTGWLDTATASAKCKMLSSKSLQIANNKRGCWKWNSIPGSRFPECAELASVYFLAVTGEVELSKLSAGKNYEVYLVYKLASSTSGLKGIVQTSSLRLYGQVILASNRVSLDPEARGSSSDVTYPVERSDGWFELKLAEFINDDEMLAEKRVIVDLRDEDVSMQKTGLIVEGMEFRSV
ncbi:unnamed protein product [Alopecurus aequalis]